MFVIPMKFSINTSKRFMNDSVDVNWRKMKSCAVPSMQLSKGGYGRLASLKRASITFHAVYEAAQKKGGDWHHPIFSQLGTTMLIS